MMTKELLDAIRARVEAANQVAPGEKQLKGEYRFDVLDDDTYIGLRYLVVDKVSGHVVAQSDIVSLAIFYVSAQLDVMDLLNEIDRLRAEGD